MLILLKNLKFTLLPVLALLCFFSAEPTYADQANPFISVYNKVAPSTVSIGVSSPKSGTKKRNKSLGSGFFYTNRCYVITNSHVVADYRFLAMKDDAGQYVQLQLVGSDLLTDIAVLVPKTSISCQPVEWRDSDTLSVGSFVAALGNPFGFSQAIHHG